MATEVCDGWLEGQVEGLLPAGEPTIVIGPSWTVSSHGKPSR